MLLSWGGLDMEYYTDICSDDPNTDVLEQCNDELNLINVAKRICKDNWKIKQIKPAIRICCNAEFIVGRIYYETEQDKSKVMDYLTGKFYNIEHF